MSNIRDDHSFNEYLAQQKEVGWGRPKPSSLCEVFIEGGWHSYDECRSVQGDEDPSRMEPVVKYPTKVLAVGIFEERINGVIQGRLTKTTFWDGTPYVPEVTIYWQRL